MKQARKHGYQIQPKYYSVAKYQEGGEAAWAAADGNSKHFINKCCDQEEAEELAKEEKRDAVQNIKKRARLDTNDSPASAAASAVVASPTPPPPPVTTPSQPVIQPPQRVPNSLPAAAPAVPFEDLKHYLVLAKITTQKMRMTVNGYEAGNHYSMGTCNRVAAVGMRCMLNHIDDNLNKIEKELS